MIIEKVGLGSRSDQNLQDPQYCQLVVGRLGWPAYFVSSFSLCKANVNSIYTVSEKGHVHSIRNGL
jgi:hypothetical protein